MRTPVVITLAFIVALATIGGATIRWFKFKKNPSSETIVEHFEVDPEKVRNPEPNLNYYGTINVTKKITSGDWPKVEVIYERDTVSSEDGGYFGKPK